MKKKITKNSSGMIKMTVLGAAGIAGLAATAYFFLGPKGKKNQKNVKAWAIKMKRDVIKQIKIKAGEINQPIYNKIIDTVTSEYKKEMKASHEEINELSKDLKKHWETIGSLSKNTKKSLGKIKKVVKKGKVAVKKSFTRQLKVDNNYNFLKVWLNKL